MKPSKNVVIVALGVFSLTVSVVAWKSYWKAAQLEAASIGDDIAALRQQLADADKRRLAAEARLASRTTARTEALSGDVAEARPAREAGPAGGRGRGGRGGAEMEAVMAKPEMQRLMALQQKAALDGRYGALFKSLNLSGDKLATFKNLLAEKEATLTDTMRVAREQGLDPRSDPEGFKKLMATTQASADDAIKAAIGDVAFAEYQQYQTTQPQRAVVNQLQQSLSATEPLTSAQAEQLVQVLAATAAQSGTTTAGGAIEGLGGGRGGLMGGFGGGGGAGGGGGGGAVITTAAVAQAQTVLSSTQLQALQDLQQLQQAQQQAQKIMRESGVGGPPAGGRG